MMDNITLSQLMTWGTVLMGFCGVAAYFIKPVKTFVDRVDKIEKQQVQIDHQIAKSEQNDKMILKCLNAILLHMESGNGTGELRKQKKELDDYLIER